MNLRCFLELLENLFFLNKANTVARFIIRKIQTPVNSKLGNIDFQKNLQKLQDVLRIYTENFSQFHNIFTEL